MAQIGKEPGGIFVKMQKRPAFGTEDPKPLLDEDAAPAEVFDQIAERCEGIRIGVFHLEAL